MFPFYFLSDLIHIFLKDIWVTQKVAPKCFTVKSKGILLRNHVLKRYSTVVKYILCSAAFCVANVTTVLNFVFWTNTKYGEGPFLLVIALGLISAIYGRTVQSSIVTTSRLKVCWGILFFLQIQTCCGIDVLNFASMELNWWWEQARRPCLSYSNKNESWDQVSTQLSRSLWRLLSS